MKLFKVLMVLAFWSVSYALNVDISVSSMDLRLGTLNVTSPIIFTKYQAVALTINSTASSWDVVAYTDNTSANWGFYNPSANHSLTLNIITKSAVVDPATLNLSNFKMVYDKVSPNVCYLMQGNTNFTGPMYLYFGTDATNSRAGYYGAYINLKIIEHYLGWIDNFGDLDSLSLLGGYWAPFPPASSATINIVATGLNGTDGALSFNYNVIPGSFYGFTVDFVPTLNVYSSYTGVSFYARGINTTANVKMSLKNKAITPPDYNYHSRCIFVSSNESRYDLFFEDFAQGDFGLLTNLSNTLQNLSGVQFQLDKGAGTLQFDEIKFHSLTRNYFYVDDFEDGDLRSFYLNYAYGANVATANDGINSNYYMYAYGNSSAPYYDCFEEPVPNLNFFNGTYTGMKFRLKGNTAHGIRVEVKYASNTDYALYGKDFPLNANWTEYSINFLNDFTLPGWGSAPLKDVGLSNIVSIRFKILNDGTTFYLDDIKLTK